MKMDTPHIVPLSNNANFSTIDGRHRLLRNSFEITSAEFQTLPLLSVY
jgi:hypothetical protein